MVNKVNFSKINFINVIGTSGSGKTTFCRKLSEILNKPHIEMDKIFWKANWTMPTDEEFYSKLRDELNCDCWILDGNYKKTTFIKWEKTEVVIWLDYSFTRTFYQVFRRVVNRSITKKEIWEDTGNRESFAGAFFNKDSILLWVIKTHRKTRLKYNRIIKNNLYPEIHFIRLKNPKETEKFLKALIS